MLDAITPPADHAANGTQTGRGAVVIGRRLLLGAYAAAYLVWFFVYGVIIDRVSVVISVAALVVIGHLGRPWSAWRRLPIDLALYVLLWVAYDETRGAADQLGMPLQVESVRDIDRALFFGADPTVWLQRRFLTRRVGVHDVVASVVYYSHFFVPVLVVAVLWIHDRARWIRLMRRLATVIGVACAMFVLLPTAPPWMAAGGDAEIPLDALPPLRRTAGNGWRRLGLEGFVHVWDHGRDWTNRTAAMPSLHAALALLVVAFFMPSIRTRWARAALLAYPVLMGVSLVYLAEHYVIDVLAGWAVVAVTLWAWDRIERRRTGAAAPAAPPIETATETAIETATKTAIGTSIGTSIETGGQEAAVTATASR